MYLRNNIHIIIGLLKQLTIDEYNIVKNRFNLLKGLCETLSALHSHCNTDILK